LIIERLVRRLTNLETRTIPEYRHELEMLTKREILPRGTRVEKVLIGDLPAEWVVARDTSAADKRAVLHFHGGGYVSGSCSTHRDLAARISKQSGLRLLTVDYRLAPEYRYPAALDDALRSYRWLRASGVGAEQIAVGGDSAGGGLALELLLELRERGEKLPKAAFFLSPWLSPVLDGESYRTRAQVDPFISEPFIRACAEAYFGENSASWSERVLFDRDLHGLPEMLVQVGEDELLFSDSVRLVERARAAGVEARLDVWKEMWHVFQSFAVIVPEAKRALVGIGVFLREQLGPSGGV
jgi:monoterpene epsilon-lactone hydrolase